MRLGSFAKATAVLAMALATGAAAPNWNTQVERIDGAHVIGNPKAPRTLTEFVSYTCPACGNFARTGEEALKLAYVGPGTIRLEVRHIVRDPVDLTAALLTWCGDKTKFPRNHAAIMHAQPRWMARARSSTPAQQQRWSSGELPARTRAIAGDLGFYEIMEGRGYTRAALDRCLADTAMARQLADNSQRDGERYQVHGTPSFALGGKLLDGVHSWDALQPKLSPGT